jgi:hypothetical protein
LQRPCHPRAGGDENAKKGASRKTYAARKTYGGVPSGGGVASGQAPGAPVASRRTAMADDKPQQQSWSIAAQCM